MALNEKSPYGNPPPYTSDSSGPPPMATAGVTVTVPMVQTGPGIVVPVVVGQQMGPKPGPYVCKSCNAQIVTRVEQKTTTKTHLLAALLCILGCWCCVCIPYCTDSCQNADHYCPNCNAYIGSYSS